jgi:hypothetical protein
MPDRPLIVIPARLAATRLPGKPLEMINGYPMIAHVAARALEARVGPVVVAAAEAAIAKAVAGADFAALVGGGPSPGPPGRFGRTRSMGPCRRTLPAKSRTRQFSLPSASRVPRPAICT